MDVKLNLLLMGKTGQGKSATGNFLLNRKVFKISSNAMSETKDVAFSFAQFGDYTLMVVDGPGLEDTDMSKVDDKEAAVLHMNQALGMCYGGIDAFLFVIKFGGRFTAEDQSALYALKRIFGDKYLDYVVVVITYGDLFQDAMEDEQKSISFHEWCKRQTGEFRQLYEDCSGRFVLFNNREKDEGKKQTQIQEIILYAQDLRDQNGRYTSQCFQDAERERKKLILEMKAPQLTQEIQEKISLLTGDLEKLHQQPSDTESDGIRARILDLMFEIEDKDQGYGLLTHLTELVKQVEENLDDVDKLRSLATELEATRTSKTVWTALGSVVAVVGGVICLAAAPVAAVAVAVGGGVVAGVGAATTGVSRLVLGSKEEENQEQQNILKGRIQKWKKGSKD